jgi:hypothetical protein
MLIDNNDQFSNFFIELAKQRTFIYINWRDRAPIYKPKWKN